MTVHVPIPDFAKAREAMIDSQMRPAGVNDPAVIEAFRSVERERFVPEAVRPLAYMDRPVPLGGGRWLAPPTALGLLLTQLAPAAGERALVIGCGSGFSAAILRRLGLDVVAVESDPALAGLARDNGVAVIEGPMDAGHAAAAPYDLLLIDGGVELIPPALVEQLADGGAFGGALIENGISRLVVGRKSGGVIGHYSIADWGVPELPGFRRPRTFTF
jgi:protein-L-isoaspartate(D-aspartate) O-methyltransferase